MRNIVGRVGMSFTYWTPDGDATVSLGYDDVVAVLVDDAGEVYEWYTSETYFETVANFATNAPNFIHLPIDDTNREVIELALRERALYADCFGIEIN